VHFIGVELSLVAVPIGCDSSTISVHIVVCHVSFVQATIFEELEAHAISCVAVRIDLTSVAVSTSLSGFPTVHHNPLKRLLHIEKLLFLLHVKVKRSQDLVRCLNVFGVKSSQNMAIVLL